MGEQGGGCCTAILVGAQPPLRAAGWWQGGEQARRAAPPLGGAQLPSQAVQHRGWVGLMRQKRWCYHCQAKEARLTTYQATPLLSPPLKENPFPAGRQKTGRGLGSKKKES